MLFNHRAAHGRYGASHAGEEQAQVVVDFSGRADGRTRIAGVDFLFDCHGGGQSLDIVTFWFCHLAEELACIRRQALDIAPAPLGI